MRRPLLALALIIVALLALCGIVLGFLVWQNQAAMTKSIEDLRMELNKGTPAPAPSGNGTNPGTTPPTTTPPVAPPPAASTCLAEDQFIAVNSPDEKCCPGLLEVDLEPADQVDGFVAKCIGI